eukprot:425542_1
MNNYFLLTHFSPYFINYNHKNSLIVEPTLKSMDPTIEPTIEPTQTISSIYCNETLVGSTKFEGDTAYYSLINSNNENGTYFQIQSCLSQYDAELFLFDKNWNEIVSHRFCNVNMIFGDAFQFQTSQEQMNLPLKLYDDESRDAYGDYSLTIHCDSHQPFTNDIMNKYQPNCTVE